MSIGCPAIAVKDKKAHIDPTLCIGCKYVHRCVSSRQYNVVRRCILGVNGIEKSISMFPICSNLDLLDVKLGRASDNVGNEEYV